MATTNKVINAVYPTVLKVLMVFSVSRSHLEP